VSFKSPTVLDIYANREKSSSPTWSVVTLEAFFLLVFFVFGNIIFLSVNKRLAVNFRSM
jgi:hypothetical protein